MDSFDKFRLWLSSKGINGSHADRKIKILRELFKREGFALEGLLASRTENLDIIASQLKKKQRSNLFSRISDLISGGVTSDALELLQGFLQIEYKERPANLTEMHFDKDFRASKVVSPGSRSVPSEEAVLGPPKSQESSTLHCSENAAKVSNNGTNPRIDFSKINAPDLIDRIDKAEQKTSMNEDAAYVYEDLKAPYKKPDDSMSHKIIVWGPENTIDPALLKPIVTNFKRNRFLTPKWEAVTACLIDNLSSDSVYGPIFYNILKKKLPLDYLSNTISTSPNHLRRPYLLKNGIYVNDFELIKDRIEFIRRSVKALCLTSWDFSVECMLSDPKADVNNSCSANQAILYKEKPDNLSNSNYELVIAVHGKEKRIVKLVLDGREVKTASPHECMVEVAGHFSMIHQREYLVRISKQDKHGSICALVRSTPVVLRRPRRFSKHLFVETDVNSNSAVEFVKLNFTAFTLEPFNIKETRYPEDNAEGPNSEQAAYLMQTSKTDNFNRITRLILDGCEVRTDSPWQALKTVVSFFHKKYGDSYLPILMEEDINGTYKRFLSISGSRMRKPQMIAKGLYLEMDTSSIDAANLIKMHFKAFAKKNKAWSPNRAGYPCETNQVMNSSKVDASDHDFVNNGDAKTSGIKDIDSLENEKRGFCRSQSLDSPYINGYELKITDTGKERALKYLMLDGSLVVLKPAWRALYYVAAHFAETHGVNYLRRIREADIEQQYKEIIKDNFKSMVRPNLLGC